MKAKTKGKAKAKKAPRQIWTLLYDTGAFGEVFTSKREATSAEKLNNSSRWSVHARVVGPYVLAERVRHR